MHSNIEGNHLFDPESMHTRSTIQKLEAQQIKCQRQVRRRVNKDKMKMPLLCDSGANQSSWGPGPGLHSQRRGSANERNVRVKEGHPGPPTQERRVWSQNYG